MLIEHRAHREIEEALADRQTELHLAPHLSPRSTADEGIANDVAHAVGRGKPRRVPERLAEHRPIASARIPASAVLLA